MKTDTTLHRPDGTVLRGWIRQPARPDPARSVWIVHGLGEHLGRHESLADWLLERGFTVAGHDHRGHGRSDGPRGAVARSADLVDDLEAGLAAQAERLPRPLLFGQSLGGLTAGLLALRAPELIRGLIMSSPALDPGLSRFKLGLQRLLLALAPDLPVPTGLRADRLSHDPAVARRWQADPLVHGRITARLLDYVVRGSEQAVREASRLAVPALLQYGTDDSFVSPEGSRRFAAAAPASLLTVHEYPGLRHELQQEPEALRAPVRADLARWLTAHA